jgi:hypothetical protein
VLAVTQEFNRAVGKAPVQSPPPGAGFDTFEFWLPQRRPRGKNLALKISPPLAVFGVENLRNGVDRPTTGPNAWLAAPGQATAILMLDWPEPVAIARLELSFDTDFDHPLESVLLGHPEDAMPFCVPHVRVRDEAGRLLAELRDNRHSYAALRLGGAPVRRLLLEIAAPPSGAPAALFAVRAYSA